MHSDLATYNGFYRCSPDPHPKPYPAVCPQIVLATYYSIPVVSFRAATWGPVWTRKEANFTVDELMRDWHPNARGHQCVPLLTQIKLTETETHDREKTPTQRCLVLQSEASEPQPADK